MVAVLNGDFVNMNELAHIVDSSRESILAFRDQSWPQLIILTNQRTISKNVIQKAFLPPSSAHMGERKMTVINRVDMDQITTVQLLLHKLDSKPKQGFEGTEKQEGTIVSYS